MKIVSNRYDLNTYACAYEGGLTRDVEGGLTRDVEAAILSIASASASTSVPIASASASTNKKRRPLTSVVRNLSNDAISLRLDDYMPRMGNRDTFVSL